MLEITPIHWIYIAMIVIVLGVMIMRRATIIPCIIGVFIIGVVGTGSIVTGIQGVFDGFIMAGVELLDIIFIISVVVSMSKMLEDIGADKVLVSPATKIIKNPNIAFWVTGLVMLIISWFFWPSPATALVGAVLLPISLKVGLPAIGVAVAMNLFGHGVALSSDYIIQGAPTITASSAGVEVTELMSSGVPLVIVMSVVTITVAFIMLKRDMASGKLELPNEDFALEEKEEKKEITRVGKWAAAVVPIVFLADIVAMLAFNITGGAATALIGGTAAAIILIFTILAYGKEALNKIAEYIKDGFVFGMEIFAPIIPIAAFFYMGDMDSIQTVFGEGILPMNSQGILSDMGLLLADSVPLNTPVAAITETVVAGITGLDGSGFSGLSLAGSVARVFGTAINGSIAALAALGQIASIWVGGGTIIPWAIIPVAAICRVDTMELARRNLIPVIIGLFVTTVVAMFLI